MEQAQNSSQNSMSLKFKLAVEDFRSMNYFNIKKRIILVSVVYFFLFIALSFLFNNKNMDFTKAWFILQYAVPLTLLFIVIFIILMFMLIRYRTKKVYEGDTTLQQEQQITVDNDGYTQETSSDTVYVKWHEVYKVVETKKMFYIYTDKEKSLFLPKRFLERLQVKQFKTLVEAKVIGKKFNWDKRSKD